MKGLRIIIAVALWSVFLAIAYTWFKSAFFVAYLSIAALYWISVAVTGKVNPLHIVIGADGRLSTSKFQFFLWTAVVVFAYVLLYAYRGKAEVIRSIPANVLIVMGFSVTTAVGAKGITVSYLNSGQISKPASTQVGSATDLVTHDDSVTPDLTKIQMLIWTVIAAAIYIHNVYYYLDRYKLCVGDGCVFPDIDTSLMVLMGLSQGAYLGNKIVAAGAPQITSISPGIGTPGLDLTVSGQSLGAAQSGNLILINGQNMGLSATAWTDTAIHFTVPQKKPDGTQWVPNEKMTVSIVINGQQTMALPFTLADQPTIVNVAPNPVPKASQATITGRGFGLKQAGSRLLLNGTDCTSLVNSWIDTQIQFTFANVLPGGAPWQPAIAVTVAVEIAPVSGFKSNVANLTTA
jgi:hypothetical protein